MDHRNLTYIIESRNVGKFLFRFDRADVSPDTQRMKSHGNPTYYAVWQDETLNKGIRDLAGSLHSQTFERRALTQINAKRSGKRGASQSLAAASSGAPPKRLYAWEK